MSADRRETTGRRRADRWRHALTARENWYRDVWLLLLSAVVLWAAVASVQNSARARHLAEGNRRAIEVSCAATSAVVDAGRATLRGGAVIRPDRFRHELERLGLPPQTVRERGADAAARDYGASIASAVERATGRPGLARPDGTLDCRRLTARP